MPNVGGKFKPAPNEVLMLRHQRYTVRPNPSAPTFPHSAEGRRATVYKLGGPGNKDFALKVFRKKYVDASLVESEQVMARFQNLPGMLAAQRIVLGAGDDAVVDCPELMCSSLMPWIGGVTWNDILMQAEKGLPAYQPELAMRLCRHFLEIMSALQREQAAHTDIAPGNVVARLQRSGNHFVSSTTPDVQLVDLEDIYARGVRTPQNQNTGTPGYRHPSADASGQTTWCAEGDRYATAIMAAELLLLGSTSPIKQSFEFGVFGGNRESSAADKQVSVCLPYLRSISNAFEGCFEAAWTSTTLSTCPEATDFLAALPQPAVNFTLPNRLTTTFPPVAAPTVPGVQWAKIPQAGFGTSAPPPPFSPPVPPSMSFVPPNPPPAALSPDAARFWSNAPVTPTSSSVQPAQTSIHSRAQPSSGGGKIVAIILVILAILCAIIYGVVSTNQQKERQLQVERDRQDELRRQQHEALINEQQSLTKTFIAYESSMLLKSEELSPKVDRLAIIDSCKGKPVYVAVRFQAVDNGNEWVTMGWWKVEADTRFVLPVATQGIRMYFYAVADDGTFWGGAKPSASYQTAVISDHEQQFLLKDGQNSNLPYQQVTMKKVDLTGWDTYSERLICN